MVDMYYKDGKLEYPPEHVGKRTYVTCQGIKGYSVPKIYCYYYQGKYYLMGDDAPEAPSGPMVMRDLEAYKSPIDGSMITSRSQHRAHMRQHGVIEMGNEYPKQQAPVEMSRAGHDIMRAMGRR